MAGAKILELFGDAATKLCLRESGGRDEGLLRAYQSVDFLRPVYASDTVRVVAKIIRMGKTSRTLQFSAFKLRPRRHLVSRAVGTVVLLSLAKR